MSSPSASGPRARTGFTLTEILVSLGVVAVLGALVAATTSGGFMLANRVKCAANLRQLGIAIALYASENAGRLPSTSHTTGDARVKINGQWVNTIEYSWVYRLADYLSNMDEVRVCPADEPKRRAAILASHATSYLLNDTIFTGDDADTLDNMPYPSRTFTAFISNRPVSRTWDHAHCGNWTNWGAINDDVATDRHRTGERAANRLNGAANYLFADGHVETIAAADMKALLDDGRWRWIAERTRP